MFERLVQYKCEHLVVQHSTISFGPVHLVCSQNVDTLDAWGWWIELPSIDAIILHTGVVGGMVAGFSEESTFFFHYLIWRNRIRVE